MVLPQFQYKDRLDLSDRLAIAQTYVRFEGHHGLVTELAADYQTNLKQIYAILRDVEHGFAQKLPGPKPAEASRLLQRIATLEAQNQQLMRENTQLSVHQKRCKGSNFLAISSTRETFFTSFGRSDGPPNALSVVYNGC